MSAAQRRATISFALSVAGWPSELRAESRSAKRPDLDFVAGLLADGCPHLCGERFGAADLTFAALSAAVVVPPVYGVALPQPEVLPPQTAAFVERARSTPRGATRSPSSPSTGASPWSERPGVPALIVSMSRVYAGRR